MEEFKGKQVSSGWDLKKKRDVEKYSESEDFIEIDSLGITLSVSVRTAVRPLLQKAVTSWEIVKNILELHSEYGQNRAKELAYEKPPPLKDRRLVREWLSQVYDLYQPEKITYLNGRLVIIGLSIIDQALQQFLPQEFINLLKGEIEEEEKVPFSSLLKFSPSSDPAVQHADTPAEYDLLGRLSFVQALAIWLSRFWEKHQKARGHSFVMQVHGPWGSGKTTLLNFFGKALQNRELLGSQACWLVVKFNAWQHQHLTPVWWPLYDRIYRDGLRQLSRSCKDWWRLPIIWGWERGWRLLVGRSHYFLACGLLFLTFLFIYFKFNIPISYDAIFKEGNIKSLSAIATLLGTIWAAAKLFSQSLMFGSITNAEHFLQVTRDPLQKVKVHYQNLLRIIRRPVIVFIDDLDRCRTAYVVNLLESIQTLLNYYQAVFVIAADRRWLYKCFETEYKDLADYIIEPGRRMGHMFLEKAFQLSVSIPCISPEVQATYLDSLLRGEQVEFEALMIREREAARKDFENAVTEDQIMDRLRNFEGSSLQRQVRREAAILQSASKEVEASTEYFLKPFAALLEPNPRAMKRLVTAYGIYRAQAILSDDSLLYDLSKRKQLVLWTIIQLRWPYLAEEFESHPEMLEKVRQCQPKLEDRMRKLAEQEEVQKVLEGSAANSPPLNADFLRSLLGVTKPKQSQTES